MLFRSTIVKEIIELHSGQVMITSQAGEGTTVVLWLPVAKPLVHGGTGGQPALEAA